MVLLVTNCDTFIYYIIKNWLQENIYYIPSLEGIALFLCFGKRKKKIIDAFCGIFLHFQFFPLFVPIPIAKYYASLLSLSLL